MARLVRERCDQAPAAVLTSAPVLLMELTASQIRELARSEKVSSLFLHESEGTLDIKDSMKISGADYVVNIEGWKGTGVRVGVWEHEPDDISKLVIQGRFSTAPSTATLAERRHARRVTGVIRNTEVGVARTLSGSFPSRCYAPRCRIYSANTLAVEALEWAVTDRRCTVINQSFHRPSGATLAVRSFDDFLKDYLVLHFPFPTIVQAAGNYWKGDPDDINPPSNEFVNHKGYNSLSVGSHNDTADAMDGGSVFRNPTTPHGDRELPEICANGTAVTCVGITATGSSLASPAVAGSVALLQQIEPVLASWPEGNRALLLAGARNVVGRTWWREVNAGVDGSDGAGALDIYESTRIVRYRVTRDNRAQQRGWDVGWFRADDFDKDGNWRPVYRILVPLLFTSTHVKVALAWNALVPAAPDPVSTVWMDSVPTDYDLFIYNEQGELVALSATWDNSYEIAEFVGTPGKIYTVRIAKWGDAGSDYGIAWSVRNLDVSSAATSAVTAVLGG